MFMFSIFHFFSFIDKFNALEKYHKTDYRKKCLPPPHLQGLRVSRYVLVLTSLLRLPMRVPISTQRACLHETFTAELPN